MPYTIPHRPTVFIHAQTVWSNASNWNLKQHTLRTALCRPWPLRIRRKNELIGHPRSPLSSLPQGPLFVLDTMRTAHNVTIVVHDSFATFAKNNQTGKWTIISGMCYFIAWISAGPLTATTWINTNMLSCGVESFSSKNVIHVIWFRWDTVCI